MTGTESAPALGTAVAAPINSAAPRVSVNAPGQSIAMKRDGELGTNRSVKPAAMIVSGTTGQKMARQLANSTRNPPSGGPTACPKPFTAAHQPRARALR